MIFYTLCKVLWARLVSKNFKSILSLSYAYAYENSIKLCDKIFRNIAVVTGHEEYRWDKTLICFVKEVNFSFSNDLRKFIPDN